MVKIASHAENAAPPEESLNLSKLLDDIEAGGVGGTIARLAIRRAIAEGILDGSEVRDDLRPSQEEIAAFLKEKHHAEKRDARLASKAAYAPGWVPSNEFPKPKSKGGESRLREPTEPIPDKPLPPPPEQQPLDYEVAQAYADSAYAGPKGDRARENLTRWGQKGWVKLDADDLQEIDLAAHEKPSAESPGKDPRPTAQRREFRPPSQNNAPGCVRPRGEQEFGQRARKDSNLQPSDSKSVSHVVEPRSLHIGESAYSVQPSRPPSINSSPPDDPVNLAPYVMSRGSSIRDSS